jgi:hypothetical protein
LSRSHFSIGIAKVPVFFASGWKPESRESLENWKPFRPRLETYEMPLEVPCGFAETPLA